MLDSRFSFDRFTLGLSLLSLKESLLISVWLLGNPIQRNKLLGTTKKGGAAGNSIVCFGASIDPLSRSHLTEEKRRVRILRRMGTFLATESVNSAGETKVQVFGKEQCKTHRQFQHY